MRIALSAALLLLSSSASFGFGQEGHSAIAELAHRRLNPNALANVERLLGKGHSLASTGSWADDVRDARPHTYNWHFVDLPLAEDRYAEARDCNPPDKDTKGDCVIAELARLKDDLRCAATDEGKAEALKFAVHFVGDVHQPLHTVLESKGGNLVRVTSVMHGNTCRNNCDLSTNLHAMWDTFLITKLVWNWGSYVERLEEGWLKSAEAAGADAGTTQDWVEESHKEARIAWNAVPADKKLTDDYLQTATPILDRQIGRAGLRLARFLNEAYADTSACPAR
ncbi:S1/P1 nuclease [Bradyrhizobium sp. USDA 4451]